MSKTIRTRKNKNELENYKKYIASSYSEDKGTDRIKNKNLINSDYVFQSEELNNSENYKDFPLTIKSKKWFKKNRSKIFPYIISTIIIPFIFWAVDNIYNIKATIQLYNFRIEQLETIVSSLDTNAATKEDLNIQLESIANDIDDNNSDLDEIDKRISNIELQIKYINENDN